ncbi:2-hydroxyhepta-2,4-diene-1,7-dioate isomerase [Alicyclobacillus hesperidum subsp. aegles]|uniref:fumarylacetoacetate hydrolase family protein n=1 Tax=Alicyclobacillus hesperidum TaxID=89784 RepID=UPI000ACE8529|nr:fumarylacetoacetate hydrolase family protein [Alicyclobacillus hesperidum]GLG01141.1 2-hydroxyhepta-2,4-diene-1,7-dioate isomerase [Alicyclobacillus hesperidum subsp. aegles]
MKTIRYMHPVDGSVHLGIVVGDDVYSVTDKVASWTDPVPMWQALRALQLDMRSVEERLCVGDSLSYRNLTGEGRLLPPVLAPEVWASGVTYERSRVARNAETQLQDSVYDRVYTATRPELFFKATAERLVPPGQSLKLRSDSAWMVPEPELSVIISSQGDIIGYTIGNDLSSRDIEGENPLYLPQAKIFAASCSLGPALVWCDPAVDPLAWEIEMRIERAGDTVFLGNVALTQLRRPLSELVSYLLRDNPILDGTALMTGTGIVPPDEFTLQPGDVVAIEIQAIGQLVNPISAQGTRAVAMEAGV